VLQNLRFTELQFEIILVEMPVMMMTFAFAGVMPPTEIAFVAGESTFGGNPGMPGLDSV
jgi:hypothetical protein